MLYIHKPTLTKEGIKATIDFKDKSQDLFFSTQQKYQKYIVDELADAFVVMLLPYAMIHSEDIHSEAPVSQRLLFQINDYLIPNLNLATKRYKPIKVKAPLGDPVEQGKAIATGYSGGIDTMFTIQTNRKDITHLVVCNAGAFEGKNYRDLYNNALKQTQNIAQQLNYSIVGIDTNITEIVDEHFLSVSSYRHIACALILGKLWFRYLLSSTYAYEVFRVEETNCGFYDLLLTECLSTDYLRFYSEGGPYKRIEKIKSLSKAEEFIRNLIHVCVKDPLAGNKNCGLCEKCIRTEAAIEGLGLREKFKNCFDWNKFDKHYDEIIAKIFDSKNIHAQQAAKLLKLDNSDKITALKSAKKIVEKNKDLLKTKIKND